MPLLLHFRSTQTPRRDQPGQEKVAKEFRQPRNSGRTLRPNKLKPGLDLKPSVFSVVGIQPGEETVAKDFRLYTTAQQVEARPGP